VRSSVLKVPVVLRCIGAEDDLAGGDAADVEVVVDQRIEEAAGPARAVEHDGPRHLDLAHRQFPPVPVSLVVIGQWHGQPVQPALGEYLDGAGLQQVADGLQAGRVLAGGEPVGQLGEADARPGGLPLGRQLL